MAPQVHFISFFLLLLAGFNLPVSEDIVFIVSAAIASSIVPENTIQIFIGCFVGAYFSDIIAYSIGRFGGNKLLKINLFKKMMPEDRIITIEKYFEKYGKKTLFFGRFIPFGVRNVMFISAGLIRMKPIKFLLIDLLALCFTSTILFSLGYSFGNKYKLIFPYLNRYKIVVFSIFLLVIALIFLKKHINQKKNSKNSNV